MNYALNHSKESLSFHEKSRFNFHVYPRKPCDASWLSKIRSKPDLCHSKGVSFQTLIYFLQYLLENLIEIQSTSVCELQIADFYLPFKIAYHAKIRHKTKSFCLSLCLYSFVIASPSANLSLTVQDLVAFEFVRDWFAWYQFSFLVSTTATLLSMLLFSVTAL